MSQSAVPPPWVDQPYSIKRHGLTIDNCDSEPVQTPGCIQAHGVILVLRSSDLTVLQVSENLEPALGCAVDGALGARAGAVLGDLAEDRLRDLLRTQLMAQNPCYAFTLPATGGRGAFDATVHTTGGVTIVELEPASVDAATTSDHYALVQRSIGRLQGAQGLAEFCQIACEEVRTLARLDRVMAYRFHDDGHGEVVAEARRPDLAPWLGQHYPASDIPTPARAIFQQIWLRPVPDAQGPLAELVPLVNPDSGRALDMTHCVLRGASVMYTEYLQNMGVRSSLTMSIRRGDELWGLIAGHHYAPRPYPWQQRAALELFAQVVSLQHKAAEDREQAAYRQRMDDVHRQLVASAAEHGELAAMFTGSPTLLDALDAQGAAMLHRGRWWRVGATPSEPELDALAAWLHDRPELASPMTPVFACDRLPAMHPPAQAYAGVASGVLAAPLSRSAPSLLLWFRPEVIRTVRWAGHPDDKPSVPGPHGPRLTPRRSFELFVESVRLCAMPWHPAEIHAVLRFRVMLMELVVSQADRLVDLNAQLRQRNDELDAFAYVASHDLKEPLRGIHKYAHQLAAEAGESAEPQRRRVDGIMRLAVRMDSLIESLLTYSRMGRVALDVQTVDLGVVVAEALELVAGRSSDRSTDVVIPRPLPAARCDHVRARDLWGNLLSNALKYNDKPTRRIEIGYLAPGEHATASPGVSAQTIFYVRDNGIGIAPRYHTEVFRLFRRLHAQQDYGGGTGAGLTIVQKIIERHGGRIWVESTLGAGATFYFTLGQP